MLPRSRTMARAESPPRCREWLSLSRMGICSFFLFLSCILFFYNKDITFVIRKIIFNQDRSSPRHPATEAKDARAQRGFVAFGMSSNRIPKVRETREKEKENNCPTLQNLSQTLLCLV